MPEYNYVIINLYICLNICNNIICYCNESSIGELMNYKSSVENLSKNIKFVRTNICHLTQEKFAEAVNLSIEEIQKIEQGGSLPSTASLFAIANFTNVPLDFLGKDDIKVSELYTVIALMNELEKHNKDYVTDVCGAIVSMYTRIRSENDK